MHPSRSNRTPAGARTRLTGLTILALGSVALAGCGVTSADVTSLEEVPPVVSEVIEGTELKRITLSESAAERLGIETAPVSEEQMGEAARLVVPYAAVLYDAQGTTWAYENVEGLTYVRHPIDVEHIDGDLAVLASGPAIGQPVVTVGAAELWGVDTGVGGGH